MVIRGHQQDRHFKLLWLDLVYVVVVFRLCFDSWFDWQLWSFEVDPSTLRSPWTASSHAHTVSCLKVNRLTLSRDLLEWSLLGVRHSSPLLAKNAHHLGRFKVVRTLLQLLSSLKLRKLTCFTKIAYAVNARFGTVKSLPGALLSSLTWAVLPLGIEV